MKVVLTLAHARVYPFQSGWQRERPDLLPREWHFCAGVFRLLGPVLEGLGHEVHVVDKDVPTPASEDAYNRAHARQIARAANLDPDLVLEFHIDRDRGEHQSGAVVLGGDSEIAQRWGEQFLSLYEALTPIKSNGCWARERLARYTRHRKGLLERLPQACIIECGFATSATDQAWLLTEGSTQAAAVAAAEAVQEVSRGSCP